MEQLMYNKFT